MEYEFVYGPVQSRRLGRSLGVSSVTGKTCNFNCVFCELGHTTHQHPERTTLPAPDAVLAEIGRALEEYGDQVDWVTFSGYGEPTLNQALGYLITRTKTLTSLPVAVFTNGLLLQREEVRRSLYLADLVAPTLCAADDDTLKRMHRSVTELRIDDVVEGLVQFRQEYEGKLWVEVMLVHGMNDDEEHLRALRLLLDRVKPDQTYIATPCHPPAEDWVGLPGSEDLDRARDLLGDVIVLPQDEGDVSCEHGVVSAPSGGDGEDVEGDSETS
ncbi:radical SAM protein [Candidatus Latescibacterota bacterium]